MNYKITYSPNFTKHFNKLSNIQRNQVKNKLKLLATNPAHPSLRVKRIKGADSLWEMSVNMDIRIIWCYMGDTIILLLDIGHHDILKKY